MGTGSPRSHAQRDEARLAQLWAQRAGDSMTEDYPLGPGDVLEISVPGMVELERKADTGHIVRVSREGTISLPFIGIMQASGLTEKTLKEAIRSRLERDYMYNPQVNLFVREYRSRQVAVVGAVGKPGLYSLTSRTDTILDVLSLAGGRTEKAAAQIHFIPAGNAGQQANSVPFSVSRTSSALQASPVAERGEPIIIDLQNLTKGGDQIYLALPVRPQDVIIVPDAGGVLVEGWVKQPGTYPITPGLTIIGAIAAAGGPRFAADNRIVKLIRTDREGHTQVLSPDLERIRRGEASDMPVQAGDVIEVPSSTGKLVSYGLYDFATRVLSIGASVVP